jgi:hypothetical protein
MLLTLIILISLLFTIFFLYIYATPEHINTRSRTIYNFVVFTIALTACFMVYTYTYLTTGLSIERAILSLLAYLQSLLVFSIVLIVGWLFRNFIIFRGKKN